MKTHTVVEDTHTIVSGVQRGIVETHAVVSKVQRDVVDTHTVVSGVQRNVADTHTMVSEIRRDMLGSREGSDNQRLSVSDTATSTIKYILIVA